MCGITGIWNRTGRPANQAWLERMMDRLAHRGPDDRRIWIDGAIALGHLRLSIIDLSPHARQPFVTADSEGVLVYNGEVYNYLELRRQLEDEGVRFTSASDSEVVLYALHRWGPPTAVPRFNGMFAFAYFDRRDAALWLARDRLGIKPLYVASCEDRILFASELKALLVYPGINSRPNLRALQAQLITRRLESTLTPIEGIEALEPGTWWKLTPRSVEKVSYFDVLPQLDVRRLMEARGGDARPVIAQLESALLESVRVHLASDAPLATLCSGGVDSGLVTACVTRQRPETRAYVANVVANVAGDVFEGARAHRVTQHLGVELRQVDVGREDLLRLWPVATWFADQPNYTASEMPMLAIARACRKDGVKVLLSGEGADELFGGYQRHEETYKMWRAQRTRWWRWRRRRHELSRLRVRPFHGMVTWPPATLRSMVYSLDAESHVRGLALFEKLKGVEPLEDRAFLAHCIDDLCGHLRGLLRRNDRMGMAASIEVRVPFLENRLIDLAMHLPRLAKYRNGHGKWVLKSVASKCLPRDVVYAPKLGFHVPYDPFATAVGLLQDGAARDLFQWSAGTTRRVMQLVQPDSFAAFQLLSLELWARLFLRGESYDALGETLVRLAASRGPA